MDVLAQISPKEWEAYIEKLLPIARSLVWYVRKADGNFEDAVSSTLRTFWNRAINDIKPVSAIESKDDIWPVLEEILRNKCRSLKAQETTLKRSAMSSVDLPAHVLDSITGKQALTVENMDWFISLAIEPLKMLDDSDRKIAELLLQGYPVKEIATKMKCSKSKIYARIYKMRHEFKKFLMD